MSTLPKPDTVAPVGFSGVTPFVDTTGISARKFNSHLRREPERRVDPGEWGVRFDSFGRSLLDAGTRSFGIAIKMLDLAQWLSWIVAGSVRNVWTVGVGKNRSSQTQRPGDGSATRKSPNDFFFRECKAPQPPGPVS